MAKECKCYSSLWMFYILIITLYGLYVNSFMVKSSKKALKAKKVENIYEEY